MYVTCQILCKAGNRTLYEIINGVKTKMSVCSNVRAPTG